MKTAIKYALFTILGFAVLFLIVANFSTTESDFQCSGEVTSVAPTYPLTIYIKLSEYRWFVSLWSDSNASLNLEVPNTWVDYFGHLEKVGNQFQIYESYPNEKVLKGNFSSLSKVLAIELPFGFFDGTCAVIN